MAPNPTLLLSKHSTPLQVGPLLSNPKNTGAGPAPIVEHDQLIGGWLHTVIAKIHKFIEK